MSYYTLPPAADTDPEPEEVSLSVGETLTSGTVEVRRVRVDLYVAECNFCGWRKKYPTDSPNGASWDTFCHNSNRIKRGCPINPTREEGC
jgi:hypothetical protein